MIGDAGGSNQASKFGTIDLKVPGGMAKLAQAEEIREASDFLGFRGPLTLPLPISHDRSRQGKWVGQDTAYDWRQGPCFS